MRILHEKNVYIISRLQSNLMHMRTKCDFCRIMAKQSIVAPQNNLTYELL